jgi:ATP-dependent Lhr-like helicase
MRVEDAHGAPPTIPFWRGEAPARTWDLSAEVAAVREHIDRLAPSAAEGTAVVVSRLQKECGLDRRGAEQVLAYVVAGRTILGTVPTQRTVIAERFFDEGGGMQLVLHAPFGGRINRAWGLALRKRFCTTFDFELQAAATDEGLVLSLGERHSFPLETVFAFLRSDSVREVLTQAILAAPMLTTRWRWTATRSLAMLRFASGRRVPPQIQRMRAEDLLAAVFPAAVACQDNFRGDPAQREIPDHPLVQETIRDCLTEVMDVEGLEGVLSQIENGQVTCVSVETPTPSPFCHEILNANPYAFLDDAPLEERRARAVEMRRSLPPELADKVGALDPAAIIEDVEEAWPVVRDPDELHDALLTLLWLPEDHAGPWTHFLPTLKQTGRATLVSVPLTRTLAPQGRGEGEGGETHQSGQDSERELIRGYVATEQYPIVKAALGDTSATPEVQSSFHETVPEPETAMFAIVRGWMESIGPTTAEELGWMLHVPGQAVETALVQLESDGQVLRGKFRPSSMTPAPGPSLSPQSSTLSPAGVEWCHRRLLARIHRLTIGRLRKEIQPVTAAEFMRFLFRWQHLSSGARLHGETGLSEIIHQLAGFEAAASAWERSILPLRLSKYDPDLLDRLCLRGAVAWGRLSLHPRLEEQPSSEGDPSRPRRILPTSLAPISFFQREDTEWCRSASSSERTRSGC